MMIGRKVVSQLMWVMLLLSAGNINLYHHINYHYNDIISSNSNNILSNHNNIPSSNSNNVLSNGNNNHRKYHGIVVVDAIYFNPNHNNNDVDVDITNINNDNGNDDVVVVTRLNDNYCDDGLDEFNTSACSFFIHKIPQNDNDYIDRGNVIDDVDQQKHHRFKCQYELPIFESIYFSRVNDGICDCCDGSDESGSLFPIDCPNTCQEKELLLLQQIEDEKAKKSFGVERKAHLVELANHRLSELRTTLGKWHVLLPKYRAELATLKETLAAASASETTAIIYKLGQYFSSRDPLRLQSIIASIVVHSGERGVEIFFDTLKTKPFDYKGSSPDDTEALYYAMEVNTFYESFPVNAEVRDDGTVDTATISRLDASTNGMIREKIDETIVSLSLPRYSGESLLSLLVDALGFAARQNEESLKLALNAVGLSRQQSIELVALGKSVPQKVRGSKSPNTSSNSDAEMLSTVVIEKKIADMEATIKKGERNEIDAKAIANLRFGNDDELFALWGLCFSKPEKDYTYTVCPFKDARQDANDLGKYDRIEYASTTSQFTTMYFTQGGQCYGVNGSPHRKFALELVCSPVGMGVDVRKLDPESAAAVGKFEEVIEVEPCSYTGQLHTALAC